MAKNTTTETDQQLRNRLRNQAERTVLDRHRDEFEQVARTLFAKEGLTYRRRLTAEEKAQQEERKRQEKAERDLARLLEKHPELRGRIVTDEPTAPTDQINDPA